MTVIPADYGQANLLFTGAALPLGAEVTFGFLNRLDKTADAIAADIVADFGPVVSGTVISSGVQFSGVRVKLGPADIGPTAEVSASVNGGGAATTTSPNVSFLVHKQGNFGGRAGRGRMYLPGVVEGSVDPNGELTSGAITGLQTLVSAFLAALESDDIPMYLLHGATSPLDGPTDVTSLAVDSRVATQRRRLRR